MSNFELYAIKVLKDAGLRITMPRVQVLRVLESAEQPLGAYAICQAILSSNGRIDVVSVYRILDALLDCGLVLKVGSLEGKWWRREEQFARYETAVLLVNPKENTVREVEVSRERGLDNFISSIARMNGAATVKRAQIEVMVS